MIRLIRNLFRPSLAKRLRATMRPNPDYRTRKLAQMTTERQARYWRNVT